MAKQFDSHTYPIGGLLGKYERRCLTIPRFQRGFSWERNHVSAFWEDFTAFLPSFTQKSTGSSYFLGPIVTRESDDEIVILDGQQRIATATILLAAIRDTAQDVDPQNSHDGAYLARDIQRDLIERDGDRDDFVLRLGELDRGFFVRAIQKNPPSPPRVQLRSHQLILDAYSFFRKELSRSTSTLDPKAAIALLTSYRDCLTTGITMVAVIVQSDDDAFSIFETLNDRGLRLSVPDLLLNHLMQKSSKTQQNAVRQDWNRMLNQMGKRDISSFVRHMWVSRYGDLKSRGLFTEIKRYLAEQSVPSTDFAAVCAEECEDYIAIIDQTKRIPKEALRSVTALVRYLRVQPSLPLLLSGLGCLDDTHFAALAKAAVALAIRHSAIANLNPGDLETAFYQAARGIRDSRRAGETSSNSLKAAKRRLADIDPEDSVLLANSSDVVLEKGEAQWIITAIADSLQTRTGEVTVDSTLEHIFPQNAGIAWANRKQMEPYIWHLGNLTMLGKPLNKDAANSDFPTKCAVAYGHSEIKLTNSLLNYNVWGPLEVESRAKDIVRQIISVWPRLR